MSKSNPERPVSDDRKTDWFEIVQKNVSSLRFGSVQITVHDGRVTQVESIEKTRFVSTNDETTRLNTNK